MDTAFRISAVAAVLTLPMGCGPDAPDEDEPPGTLEFEDPYVRCYRLDRRVDIVGVNPMVDRSGCGILTDRAYDDLIDVFESLDPRERYDSPDDCTYGPPIGLLHIDGFEHSPFACSWYCCNEDLIWAAIVYWAAASSLYSQEPNIEGEIYIALEPDTPCPD